MILGKKLYMINYLICFHTTICYKFLHIGRLSWSDVSFFSYYGLKQDIFSSVKMKLLFSETVKESTDRWAWLCFNIIFLSFTALESHLCILLFLLSTIYFLLFFLLCLTSSQNRCSRDSCSQSTVRKMREVKRHSFLLWEHLDDHI